MKSFFRRSICQSFRFWKIFNIVICFCLPFLFFTGCKKASEKNLAETESFILGFSQIGAESAWRIGNTRSVQEAAASAGIQLLFFNAEQKQENQIRAIRSFIAYQVDVIAFVPIVSDGWKHVLDEAWDARIPVLVCDREINIQNESLYAGFIGTNSEQEGRSAAEFLIKKFEGDKTHSAIRIVEISGTEGSSVAIKRAIGFREVLDEYHAENKLPRFDIVHSASGDFLRSKGYELMCTILDTGTIEEIDVVFSHNDGMTLGVIDAMKERDINPGQDIIIVTIDAEQAAIDALKRGEVNCVVECNPKQGPDILRLAALLARGEVIPRITYMKNEVFSEFDDLSRIPTRGY